MVSQKKQNILYSIGSSIYFIESHIQITKIDESYYNNQFIQYFQIFIPSKPIIMNLLHIYNQHTNYNSKTTRFNFDFNITTFSEKYQRRGGGFSFEKRKFVFPQATP